MTAWAPALLESLAIADSRCQGGWPEADGEGAKNLRYTLRWLEGLLQLPDGPEECSPALRPSWQAAATLVRDAQSLLDDLLDVAAAAPIEAEGLLHKAVGKWVERLGRVVSGSALLPLAWPHGSQGKLHAALAVVHRVSRHEGHLVIINPRGSGSEYHFQRLEGSPAWPRLSALPTRVGPIRWGRLCSSAFWLFVLQPLIRRRSHDPHPDPHPALLYEVLLPFLTRQPRTEQVALQLQADAGEKWHPVPWSDRTKVHCVLQALAIGLGGTDAGGPQNAAWTLLLLQWEGLRRALSENAAPSLAREACRSLARAAARTGRQPGHAEEWRLAILERLHQRLQVYLSNSAAAEATDQVLPEAPKDWRTLHATCSHRGLERLAAQEDGPLSTGALERVDLVLPVPLVLVPTVVGSYHEAAVAVHRCVRACSLLSNQRSLVANADLHTFALTQHLFFVVLPVPMSQRSSEAVSECFWQKSPVQFESQVALFKDLQELLRHFLAASVMLPQTEHLHTVRLLTLAAAVAVLDAIVRRVPGDGPSQLARVYSGKLSHNVRCSRFSLAPVPLAPETADLPLVDPSAVHLRTKVLDYLNGMAEDCSAERSVFCFSDMGLGAGDLELLHRIALLQGFSRDSTPDRARLGAALVGKHSEFLAAFPGLESLRDAAFLFRLFCQPVELQSEGRPWSASDVELQWSYQPEENRFKVVGFQQDLAALQNPIRDRRSSKAGKRHKPTKPQAKNQISRLLAFFTGDNDAARSSMSPAIASNWANKLVDSEEDALHLPEVPTFGWLTHADGEQLMAYLTVPYLRVPLILRFFNDRTRCGSLACPQLQAILDAVLFEPGDFQEEGREANVDLERVMSLSESALETAAGRFIHELVNSPVAVTSELDGIFQLAMERDMPTYSSSASAVLYVVRLWARTAAFTQKILKCSDRTRGFANTNDKVKAVLTACAESWFSRLRIEAAPMLERWCGRATRAGEVQVACKLWAHLAFIHRWGEEELSAHGVSTLLSAELYINANFGTIASADGGVPELGFVDTEIFELFHETRPRVYAWLRRAGAERNRVFEHVVAVVSSSHMSQHVGEVASLGRQWAELENLDSAGRFAPSVPAPADPAMAERHFARWLAGWIDTAPVEVNLNFGQLQFRQHRVEVVPQHVLQQPEFFEIFPKAKRDVVGITWSLVERTPRCERYRFHGLRYEFRLWTAETPRATVLFPREFTRNAASEEEVWIVEAVESTPAVTELWTSGAAKWFAPEERQTGSFAQLLVTVGPSQQNEGSSSPSARAGYVWKELAVFRSPATHRGRTVVHMYQILQCGSHFYRSQTFTSEVAWSLSNSLSREDSALAGGENSGRATPSLEIVHEDASGESVLVPQRFLAGALPDCVLEVFEFWRGRSGWLVGKMKVAARQQASVPTAMVVRFCETGLARVQRVTLDPGNRIEEERQIDCLLHADATDLLAKGDMLVDLLHASLGSGAWEIARWALQLDDPAHVLVWTQKESLGEIADDTWTHINAVEFPRLGLSFTRSVEDGRLNCDQHGGLMVVEGALANENLLSVLHPFVRFVLLEDATGEHSVLVTMADRPQRTDSGGVALVRGDSEWLSSLRLDQRHEVFAVHTSCEFLITTTLAAQLYLMLLYVLQGMYCEACASVIACMASGFPCEPEERRFWQDITVALQDDRSLDAVALRLKLMLQLHRQGQPLPERWDLCNDLATWTARGADSMAGRLLTPVEDAALLGLLVPPEDSEGKVLREKCSESTAWELRVRKELYTKLFRLCADRARCTHGGGSPPCSTVVIPGRSVSAAPGPSKRGRLSIDSICDERFFDTGENAPLLALKEVNPSPEDAEVASQRTGWHAVPLLLKRLPPKLPRDFFFLYELLAHRRRSVWLSPGDDPAVVGELLAFMLPPEQLRDNTPLAGLLRALEANPNVADRMPKYAGIPSTFTKELMSALQEHRRELRVPQTKHSSITIAATKWAFKIDEQGRWALSTAEESVPEVAEEALEPAGETVAAPDDAGETEVGGLLTNRRLCSIMALLQNFEDRRFPSMMWDFDCTARRLGEVNDLGAAALLGGGAEENPKSSLLDVWGACRGLQAEMPSLNMSQIPSLISKPLAVLGLTGLVKEEACPVVGDLPILALLGAPECPIGQTSAGCNLRRRANNGVRQCRDQATEPRFLRVSPSTVPRRLNDSQFLLAEVERLLHALTAAFHEAREDSMRAARLSVELANGLVDLPKAVGCEAQQLRAAHRLGQLGGSEATLTFQDVMQLIMVRGGLEVVLPHVNPQIQAREVANTVAACTLAMLLSTRTAVCRRCIVPLINLRSLLRQAVSSQQIAAGQRGGCENGNGLVSAIAEAADQVARELGTEQHCFEGLEYDPRFLCFEFIAQIALRKKQVRMVRCMAAAVQQGKPLVHQMLMGEGKTTVVTPLLVLLTATAERVCVVCCPTALLEFTRQVLRERLCGTLARPVVVFSFSRSTAVSENCDWYSSLLHAQDARAVLCTGPTAPKSIMLKFLLTVNEIDSLVSGQGESGSRGGVLNSLAAWLSLSRKQKQAAVRSRLKELRYEMKVLSWAFLVFGHAVLLLDDIDLLMHPLRSELHWPLGDPRSLDFTTTTGTGCIPAEASATAFAASHVANSPIGTRWQAAFHLLDGLFSCHAPKGFSGPAVSTFGSQSGAAEILKELRAAVAEGLEHMQLQATPHLVLMSTNFYHLRLRPLLARWMLLWLRRRHPMSVSDADIIAYLGTWRCTNPAAFRDLGDNQMKALNLARVWLVVLLPHIASRIHRVHYGLLDEGCTSWEHESRARRNFAVPFVGKDAPSETSQFSHPDVQIALTWLAHRFDGLRHGDFVGALSSLCRLQRSQPDVAPRLRRAHRLYAAWVTAAGGHVRGASEGKLRRGMSSDSMQKEQLFVLQGAECEGYGAADAVVPPLEWVDTRDEVQVAAVSHVLRASPFLMEFYLHEDVFPQLLLHTDAKLSASGQDLGSEVFCSSRLGFSGTPNDLLPRALGSCEYEPADDAKMICALTDPTVVEVHPVDPPWHALSLLRMVAAHRPSFSALIDVGALITGLSNVQVAQVLLDNGLPYDAVVYLDHGGEQCVLRRDRPEPVKLAHCTLPPQSRFVFYDQVHTTGIDIRHASNACAALTLGKDSTFRDFAQGAYRMRGIARGQRLKVLLTPEIAVRVHSEVLSSVPEIERGASFESAVSTEDHENPAPSKEAQKPPELHQICAWLFVRQASAEHEQHKLLRWQSIEHEGRRCAFQKLMDKCRSFDEAKAVEGIEARERQALALFRERVNFTIDTTPDVATTSFANPLETLKDLLDEAGSRAIQELRAGNEDALEGRSQPGEHDFFVEQEQEKEQEEEEEEEEEAHEAVAEATQPPPWQQLPRDNPPEPWLLEVLSKPPDEQGPFQPASRMSLPSTSGKGEVSVQFPQGLWASKNFLQPGKGSVQRRLRTPVIVLEWVPDDVALSQVSSDSTAKVSSKFKSQLRLALDVLGLQSKEVLSSEDMQVLLGSIAMGMGQGEITELLAIVEQLRHGRQSGADQKLEIIAAALQHALVQPGRYYVLLTLAEAEAVRVALHSRSQNPVFLDKSPGCRVALRMLRRSPLSLSILDASSNWQEATFEQPELSMATCVLFLGAELRCSRLEVELLWQLLRHSPWQQAHLHQPDVLREYFLSSYSVRRRAQPPNLQGVPLASLFVSDKEHSKSRREAVLAEAHERLLDSGTKAMDAFNLLDRDSDGRLGPSDFSSPQALRLGLTPQLLFRLFNELNVDQSRSIAKSVWADAFQDKDAQLSVPSSVLPPLETVPLRVLQRIRIERVSHAAFTSVWNSEGTHCHKLVSIWAADQLVGGYTRVTALKLSVGHYANEGFYSAKGRRQILQVRDTSWSATGVDESLNAVADYYCPHPAKFRNVWVQQRGTPLYVWRPVPPNESFVALGMVATTTPDPPPANSVRCVAKSLCQQVHEPHVQVWDDTGGGGRAGSIWLVNKIQALWMTEGHSAPQETFWDLAEDSIWFDAAGRPSVQKSHEKSSQTRSLRSSSTLDR